MTLSQGTYDSLIFIFETVDGTSITLSDVELKQTCDIYTQVADVLSATDYYPFGMQQPGRVYNSGDYRYGFNGKEMDDEVKGSPGTQYDYGFRIYDPRIGKFLSVDPLSKSFPWYTPYQFAGNKPIWCVDIDGMEEGFATVKSSVAEDGVTTIIWEVIPNFSPSASDMGRVQYTYPDGRIIMKSPSSSGNNSGFRKTLMLLARQRAKRDAGTLAGPVYENEKISPPPPPTPKPLLRKPTPPAPVVTPAEDAAAKVVPLTPKSSTLNLEVRFEGRRSNFLNPVEASRILTPILKSLLADPDNSVTLSPNTEFSKGEDIIDLWGWSADADTSDELVKMRGQTITNWFTDKGTNKDQIKISITDKNFNNKVNVTGTLTEYDKKTD